MASVFHDTLHHDVEQAQLVSSTLHNLSPEIAAALPYHPVKVVALQPSFSLDDLARKHVADLPETTRNTLKGLGACAVEDVEIEKCPQRGQFLPDLQPHSSAMGQKDGEK